MKAVKVTGRGRHGWKQHAAAAAETYMLQGRVMEELEACCMEELEAKKNLHVHVACACW